MGRAAAPRAGALVLTVVVLSLGPLAAGARGQGTDTSTTVPVTTSTLAPTTTAPPTSAPTTTTTLPVTSTTRARPTTTTSQPTTTTTAPTSKSSATWGWALLAVVLALAIGLIAVLIARTRRQGRVAAWLRSVTPAIAAAELARDLVLSQTESDVPQRRASVGVQVDEAVDALDRCAASAPDAELAAPATRAAESLRGLAFAVEADHLLRSGGEHPTGAQLASADAARRNRAAELEGALRDLKAAIAPKR
jgi:hypothetical protein